MHMAVIKPGFFTLAIMGMATLFMGCGSARAEGSATHLYSGSVGAPVIRCAEPIASAQGVSITLAARAPTAKTETFIGDVAETATWFTTQPGTRNYKISRMFLEMPKDDLAFHFSIINDSDQALSFEKAIIGISINGRLLNVTQDSYRSLHAIAVPPKTRTGDIFLPAYSLKYHEQGKAKVIISNIAVGQEIVNLSWELEVDEMPMPVSAVIKTSTELLYPDQAARYGQEGRSAATNAKLAEFDVWEQLAKKRSQ